MEVLIGGAVIGLGYLFSKKELNRNETQFLQNINGNKKPNGNNIMDSRRSYNIWQAEQKRAQKLFKKTENPEKIREVKEQAIEVMAQKFTDKDEEIQKELERYARFLGTSPRTIKRFANLYRFYRFAQ